MTTTLTTRPDRDHRVRAAILIGLCCFAIYNANLRSISAGDTYPARYLPFAILQHRTVFLNPVAQVTAQGRGDGAFWMLHRPDGHIMSLYPIVVPVVVAPLYLPAVEYLHARGGTNAALDETAKLMEKLAASFVAALSAAFMYLLLRRRTDEGTALLLTIAYALGTTTWGISSQALWQHGVAQLLIVLALLMLTAPCTLPRLLAAGLLLGATGASRPPDVVLGGALGLYALYWAGRRRALLLTVVASLPMLAVLAYNEHVAGNVFGGYGVIGKAQFFAHPLLPGIAGILVSPTRGLLLFSPFLIFLAWMGRTFPRDRDERLLTFAMLGAVVVQIVLYAKTDWRSGLSWGPRYMTDLLPLLIWMLVPVVAALRGAMRAAFVALVAVSVAIEAIGAFAYVSPLDLPIYANDVGYTVHDMRAAWVWRNSPVLTALHHGVATPEFASRVHGNLDAIETPHGATRAIAQGEEAFVAGWALAGHAAPAQVAVSIDGHQSIATSTFTDRPDVRDAMHTAARAGWRMAIDTASLAPGVHQLTAFAWISGRGEGHYIGDATLTVRGVPGGLATSPAPSPLLADLDAAAHTAASRIREHQSADGYWITTYTSAPRFADPRPEMNTFTTSLLVDLAAPVARANELEPALARARQHLTAQIEPTGLVRYHGLPNAPGIGTLGCVITPDTDDTALVWRIAPPANHDRFNAALATIEQYRAPNGLYRSWLARRENFQCLDPGADPNPTDIAIQMHLLMLLAEARPPAAQSLCTALRKAIDDDRIWVYYRKTPIVPIVRIADLARAGCALELPESRMRTEFPEQQIWVTVVRMLANRMPGGAPPDPTLVRAVLRELARDDFALVRSNPPLLFHNDLTATVPRYYWSEDVGYALWLRLLDDYEHPRAGR